MKKDEKKKPGKLEPPSEKVKKKQVEDYSEGDFLDALDKATNQLDQEPSERDPGSPKKEAENRPAD